VYPIGRKYLSCVNIFFFPKQDERKSIASNIISFVVKSILPETTSILDSRLLPPSEQQICLLRKVLAAGMVDRLAK
jgi:hypothetical protein